MPSVRRSRASPPGCGETRTVADAARGHQGRARHCQSAWEEGLRAIVTATPQQLRTKIRSVIISIDESSAIAAPEGACGGKIRQLEQHSRGLCCASAGSRWPICEPLRLPTKAAGRQDDAWELAAPRGSPGRRSRARARRDRGEAIKHRTMSAVSDGCLPSLEIERCAHQPAGDPRAHDRGCAHRPALHAADNVWGDQLQPAADLGEGIEA
jgi:hypothetical protein